MPRLSTFEHPESVAAGYSDPEDYNVLFSAKKLSRVVQNSETRLDHIALCRLPAYKAEVRQFISSRAFRV